MLRRRMTAALRPWWPWPLPVDPDGNLHAGLIEPVLGPAMSVIVRNDTASDVTLSISVYLAP